MRKLLFHPDAVLRRRAESIDTIDPGIVSLVADMIRIMKEAHGLGLAAPQVGASKRIFVTEGEIDDKHDMDDEHDKHDKPDKPDMAGMETKGSERVFINPKFLLVDGLLETYEEGCLSLPDIRGSVRRQPHVIVEALDLQGRTFTMEGSGLMARCWQHEMDHLDGVLIIDRMSVIDRIVNRKRLRALESAGELD